MNIKELLQKVAAEELSIDEAAQSIDEHIADQADDSKSGMVPRKRLNDKNDEIKDLQDEIAQRDDQITDLKESTEDDSELQKQIDNLQQENADWSERHKESQLNNAIKLAVAKDANDANDVLALLDKDGLELDGDSVKGLDEKVSALRESKPYLFEQPKGKTGRTPGDGEPAPSVTKEQFDKMNYEQRLDVYNNHKELYDQYTK
ncbi:phage scaffolding protein [Salinicoccus albus]|uniref:phage scaffolding protein n=1 Tax=Salinicoccus albus TaxID=418756 RepID=UPI00036A9470|nr:phage scaffolding protein [Salinicoccus albus]